MIILVLTYCSVLSLFDNKSRVDRLKSIDSRATGIVKKHADQARAVISPSTGLIKKTCLHVCVYMYCWKMVLELCGIFQFVEPRKMYCNNSISLNLPSDRTELSKRSVYFSGAKLYNELPVQIWQLDSFEKFRKSINTFFDWDRIHWIIVFLILGNIDLKVKKRSEMLLNFSMEILNKTFLFSSFSALKFYLNFGDWALLHLTVF